MTTDNDTIVFSDEEATPTPTWEDVCDLQFPFGKWKGATYHTLATQPGGRSYFRWLLKNCELQPLTKGRVNTALEWYSSKKSSRSSRPIRRKRTKHRHTPMGKKRASKTRRLAAPDGTTTDQDTDASTEEIDTSTTIDDLPTSMPKLTRESTGRSDISD